MREIERAIEYFEALVDRYSAKPGDDNFDICNTAIVALREKLDRERCEINQFAEGCEDCKFCATQAEAGGVAMEWISVKDRLPDEGTGFIGYEQKTGDVFLGRASWLVMIAGDEKTPQYLSHPGRGGSGYHITHWMPLPEPPKEENDA